MRLGILGGTFDPIHNAHLFIAEEARVELGLDQVLFIPNRLPPHKPAKSLTPANHRYRMTELATSSNRHFACSGIEIERGGPSFSVDTLNLLAHQLPTAEFFFITGMDTVAEIGTWRRPEEVLRLCKIAGIARPGFDAALVLTGLPASYAKRIVPLEATHLDISSTEIRERVRKGLPIRYLTPDPVVEYIAEYGLYLQNRGIFSPITG